jgi:hypothetical protein
MRQTITLIFSLFLFLIVQAQVSKTVNAITPGTLSTIMTFDELNTVTNLTINGKIDARDFVTLRDKMPVLSDLDLSNDTIIAYTGINGTYTGSSNITYPANELPQYAFCRNDITNSESYDITKLKSIILPDSITTIGKYAFGSCYTLKNVVISKAVTSIEENAFVDCKSLLTITIPISVKSIGDNAFSQCIKIQSITIPDSVVTIGISAFYRCSGLTDVIIGNSVKSLPNSVFDRCYFLSKLSIGTSVTSIGNYAFQDCALTSLNIPNSVTIIGNSAFENCMNINYIKLSGTLKTIGDYAFDNCTGLSKITIPGTLTSIGKGAFFYCTGLTGITIPPSVTKIGAYAFENCWEMKSITISNSIDSIKTGTFMGCSNLTNIIIPNSIAFISSNAFSSCMGLTEINVNASNSNYSSFDGVMFNKDKTTIVCYPAGKQGGYTIPGSVSTIGIEAFGDCKGLTSLTIPNSVVSIGERAFSSCSGLTAIYANPTTPVDLSACKYVFAEVNKTTCALYVPMGSKAAYQVAADWKDFSNIVEMTTALPTMRQSNINVMTGNGTFTLSNAEIGNKVEIYTVSGVKIKECSIKSSQTIIALNAGTYILRVGDCSGKVIIR